MNQQDFLENKLDFLKNSEENFFDDEEDEETREFLMLEKSIQQENEDEPLFNIIRKQVEKISLSKRDQIFSEDKLENTPTDLFESNENKKEIKTKKKLSFELNDLEKNYNQENNFQLNYSDDEQDYQNNYNTSQLNNSLNKNNQRPLTIYLPNTKEDLNLINHLTTLGHDLESLRHHINILPTICFGYLWKECSNSENKWRKRFFCFDRLSKLFMYHKSIKHYHKHKKPKDSIKFEDIHNVYVDHIRNVEKVSKYKNFSRKVKTKNIFIVKTSKKEFVLSAFEPELMRIWIDVIFTGAEAYFYF